LHELTSLHLFSIHYVTQVLQSIVFCLQNWWFQNRWPCLFKKKFVYIISYDIFFQLWINNWQDGSSCITLPIQADLVICSLFFCDFAYMRLKIGHFSRTYPQIYSHPWSFYMQIRYMRAYFFGPYLSHITRETYI
jgi:hypothetical protein